AGGVSGVWAEGGGGLLVGPPLVFALVVAEGAALVSLGVWLALKVPGLGRALGWAVAVFVLATVAWPIVAIVIFDDRGVFGIGLGMASPFLGPFCATLMTSGEAPQRDMLLIYFWSLAWTALGFGLAAVLLRRTLRTFDQRLGRIAAVEPAGRSAIVGDLDLRFRIGRYRISVSNLSDGDHADARGGLEPATRRGQPSPETATNRGTPPHERFAAAGVAS